jgi:hypothetical protein
VITAALGVHAVLSVQLSEVKAPSPLKQRRQAARDLGGGPAGLRVLSAHRRSPVHAGCLWGVETGCEQVNLLVQVISPVQNDQALGRCASNGVRTGRSLMRQGGTPQPPVGEHCCCPESM